MKIAFDLRRIGNPGIGRYMKCLVDTMLKEESNHEFVLLLPSDAKGIPCWQGSNVKVLVPRAGYYSVGEQIELPRILREEKVDLLHSPHFMIPLFQVCPSVVTIHDVIYLACPEDLDSRLGRTYYSLMMRASVRLSKRIITDSVFSKNEIVRYLGIDPEKVFVVYPAVDNTLGRAAEPAFAERVLAKYGIRGEYIFYTAIYKQRKNHAGLLRSFKAFLEKGGDAQLVITGPIGEGERELRNLAMELGVSSHLVLTGFVEDPELSALYSCARVYACPSLYEGFGFTVLEAMACGVPVVSSNAASLPEVGGDAALYADARNAQAFGEAMYRAFTDNTLREEMVRRGFENLLRFTWSRTAKSCTEIYEQVLASTAPSALPSTNFG
ncbi:MAG TPA: glycosyltransferase family 1 protein [Terriglobales bacterium]|nr:glycosyltransferase family 1 protein [Terriglobales bacterium]